MKLTYLFLQCLSAVCVYSVLPWHPEFSRVLSEVVHAEFLLIQSISKNGQTTCRGEKSLNTVINSTNYILKKWELQWIKFWEYLIWSVWPSQFCKVNGKDKRKKAEKQKNLIFQTYTHYFTSFQYALCCIIYNPRKEYWLDGAKNAEPSPNQNQQNKTKTQQIRNSQIPN